MIPENCSYRMGNVCVHPATLYFPGHEAVKVTESCLKNGVCVVKPDVEKTCPICGKTFNPMKMSRIFLDYNHTHYCSSDCKHKGIWATDCKKGRPVFWDAIQTHILNRDNHRCRICGSEKNLTVHHMIPVAVGGTSEDWNLITLCHTCHMKVHSSLRGVAVSKIDDKMKSQLTFDELEVLE